MKIEHDGRGRFTISDLDQDTLATVQSALVIAMAAESGEEKRKKYKKTHYEMLRCALELLPKDGVSKKDRETIAEIAKTIMSVTEELDQKSRDIDNEDND